MIPSMYDGSFDADSAPGSSADSITAGERIVRAVYYAVVLWIPLETLYVIDINGNRNSDAGGLTFSRLMGLLLFGLALLAWRRCFQRIPAVFWMLACYLGVYALSELWIPHFLDARFHQAQFTIIQMVGFFLISANLFADAKFRASLLSVSGWWASLVALGMLLGVTGGSFGENRDSVLGQDPNLAAAYFAMGAVCIAANPWVFGAKRFMSRALLALAAIVVLILAILQTGSRGGLIAFVAGILGLALCGGTASRVKRSFIAVAVIAVFGVMILREFQQGTNTATRLMATWNDGDTAGRTQIYAAAWSMVRERPLLGYGGANNLFTLGVLLKESYGNVYVRDTHNLLLALLTEVGLVGGIPFIAAIFYAMWIAWRHGKRTDDALPFALMCTQVSINLSVTGHREKIFWIVLAAAAACGMELDDAGKTEPGVLPSENQEASAL